MWPVCSIAPSAKSTRSRASSSRPRPPPVVNTGLFVLAMVLFYQPQLQAWAGGTAVATYVVTGLVGVNFLLELGVNLVLSRPSPG